MQRIPAGKMNLCTFLKHFYYYSTDCCEKRFSLIFIPHLISVQILIDLIIADKNTEQKF